MSVLEILKSLTAIMAISFVTSNVLQVKIVVSLRTSSSITFVYGCNVAPNCSFGIRIVITISTCEQNHKAIDCLNKLKGNLAKWVI